MNIDIAFITLLKGTACAVYKPFLALRYRLQGHEARQTSLGTTRGKTYKSRFTEGGWRIGRVGFPGGFQPIRTFKKHENPPINLSKKFPEILIFSKYFILNRMINDI
jgi:hypothetical protein